MISVIIPWRSDDPARLRPWGLCHELWSEIEYDHWGELEIVVESDGRGAGEKFSLARAYNRAYSRARGDVLVTYGATHLPNLSAVQRAAETARRYSWSRVFDQVRCYDRRQTNAIVAGASPGTYDDTVAPVNVTPPGIMAIQREAWAAIGGYDERFDGYGYEDCAVRNLLGCHFGVTAEYGGCLGMLDHGQRGGLERVEPTNHHLFWSEYAHLAPDLN